MTPIAKERLVRSTLRALMTGPGDISTRMDSVLALLQTLPISDRRAVAKALKPRLARAFRQKQTLVHTATHLDAPTRQKLQEISSGAGMLFFEEAPNPSLLAGFTVQLGDDRRDYSLRSRLERLKKTP